MRQLGSCRSEGNRTPYIIYSGSTSPDLFDEAVRRGPAWLTDVVAEALRQRGVDDRLAGLAARAGWAAYQHAVQIWIDSPAPSLDAHLLRAFDDLRALCAAALPAQAGLEH